MERYTEVARNILNEVCKVVVGKDDVVATALTAILAEGHILIEDIPGVGKTTLATAFANSMSLDYNRLQFTPDVLPSDVTGFSIYNGNTGEFEYKPGAVICNLFLADEINRTSSKTQSALLEVMEEGYVTVDGVTRKVKEPFMVIATQNPVGSVGTQKLPESQLDRFMVKLSMGYPSIQDEISILKGNNAKNSRIVINPVTNAEGLEEIREFIKTIHVSEEVLEYVAGLIAETRNNENIVLGISPRGGIALLAMARATAFMYGRNYVIPNDVKKVFFDVAGHRILLSQKARIAKLKERQVLSSIVEAYPVPKI